MKLVGAGLVGGDNQATAKLTAYSTSDFGNVTVGAQNILAFDLTNTSTVPISVSNLSITGAGFSVTASSCPYSLKPGGFCPFDVTFQPTAAGSVTGTLTATSNAGVQTLSVTGTGIVSKAVLSPSVVALGNATVGTSNVSESFELTNGGTAPLSITSVALTGPNAASFLIGENQCVSPLAAGASCTIGVNFLPTSADPASATLTVTDTVGTQSAALTATGVLPTMTITPASLDFGAVFVGATVTKTLTYTNTSPVSIVLTSQSVTGGVGEVFL